MFNPLPSLQMAWADNKLTNSFWYIIHDLFSFSGNSLFLSKKKKKTSQKNQPKNPNRIQEKTSNYCKIIWNLKHLAFSLRLVRWISNTATWAMYGNFSAGPEHLSDLWGRWQQGCACWVLVSKGPQATEHHVCIHKLCWQVKLPGRQLLTMTQTNDLGAGYKIATKFKKKKQTPNKKPLLAFPLTIKGLLQKGLEIEILLSAWPLPPHEHQREQPATLANCI